MQGLLIADKDREAMEKTADIFNDAGYDVSMTDSVGTALNSILKGSAQVAIISNEFDEITAKDLVPLLKLCNQDLNIILVSTEMTMETEKVLRREGIFYHLLKTAKAEDQEELRQAVKCAFEASHLH
jgi:DNA-binding NtrC family response regulator